MLDVVAPDEHELPLAVETERIDEPEPWLARPPARNAQPMREHQPIGNRQDDQGGDSANRQKSDLKDAVVGERKLT